MKKHILISILIFSLLTGVLQACGTGVTTSSTEQDKTVTSEKDITSVENNTSAKENTAVENTSGNTTSDTTSADDTSKETASAETTSTEPEPEPVTIHVSSEQELLDMSICLFTGTTNQAYSSSSCKQQMKAGTPTDRVVISYACDEPDHGGWGVLGITVGASSASKQIDVKAYTDDPEKERLLVYTLQELMDMVGISEPSKFTEFSVGAWNGGRIAGIYYLKNEISQAYEDFINEKYEAFRKSHTYNGSLSNGNATESTKAVYEFLKSTYGNACITGQMESTWMGSDDYEMKYIYKRTGKYPAIRGLDFMNNDFKGVTKRAKEWWAKGGIVTICWHTGADFSSSYNECKADDINWDKAFIEGSSTNKKLIAGMDKAAKYLKQLNDAGVPVLWRPFHEFDGEWFWWGKGGGENFVKLWQMMYDRYTNYWGLNNLIWVLGYSDTGLELENWYPGDEYVDIIGGDSYTDGANNDLYNMVKRVAADGMPITFHECGKIPTADELKADSTKWLYFMTWHTEYLTDRNSDALLKEVYTSDYFITLDELPSFK